MCGIVGICSFSAIQKEDISAVERYKMTMIRRGPDADGLWTDNENVVLGFRRLSIQDLNPRSNQPFRTHDGLHALVFNGEIYNVDELRRLLSQHVQFETTSDTEVLLQLLAIKGIDYTLSKIDGIFAFAYYNLVSKELFLARDRAGVKPLYYGVVSQRIVFSSQYDHLLHDAQVGAQAINGSALEHYFELGYIPEGEGFLHNTFLLPHGHYLKWACDGHSLTTYFQYPVVVQPMVTSLEANISESVRQQLIGDVPLGTFLSGGIDSTLVTYHARPHLSNLETFNIASIDKDYDESGYAAEFSKLFGTDHHSRQFTEADLQSLIFDNTAAFTEPFSDYSSLPTLLLSEFASQRVTVALSGDGGDELFWGYPRTERTLHYVELIRKGRVGLAEAIVMSRLKRNSRKLPFSLWGMDSASEIFYNRMMVSGARHWKKKILRQTGANKPYFFTQAAEQESQLVGATELMGLMRKMEFDLHLQRVLLKVDRASMYHSLEVRVPLLSNAMLSASSGYPFTFCYNQGTGKLPLRKLMEKYVGQELASLPKRGFVVPIGQWIRGRFKQNFYEKILDMPEQLAPFFNSKHMEQLLKEHCSSSHDWSWVIWSLYTLSSWYQHHAKGRS